jgi:hypothetical protein
MMTDGKPHWAYISRQDLSEKAEAVISDLRIGMPDDGAIREDILSGSERLAYDLAKAVRQFVKEAR